MTRPNHLSAADYTADELSQIREAVDATTSELVTLLTACAPDGRWQPTETDQLAQLSEADELLDRMYRSLGRARRSINRADECARSRFRARTATTSVMTNPPT
ncbi:hypothetical protein [Streptomyces sp. NPDC059009]|uniref:hypothetical protein n=1 Tax=Streptomyces sp. NPDC059009 TaxID=3346694 RepID=UPI003676D1C9